MFPFSLPRALRHLLHRRLRLVRAIALPGSLIIAFVLVVRALGLLESLELLVYDQTLRHRPLESPDPRITLVGVRDSDVTAIGRYPIPDRDIAQALEILHDAGARVIGLDFFRDIPIEPGNAELVQTLSRLPNVVAIEKAFWDTIAPPPGIPPERVGFADLTEDKDFRVRRITLAALNPQGQIKSAFALQLAAQYLGDRPIFPDRPNEPIRLGKTSLEPLPPLGGGYVKETIVDWQQLLKFRHHNQTFSQLSLMEVLERDFDPDWVRDRIVIIGSLDESAKDFFFSAGIQYTLAGGNPAYTEDVTQIVYGLEVHAHATSQIISQVLEGRRGISVLPAWLEYGLIATCGGLGLMLGVGLPSPWSRLLGLGCGGFGLLGLSGVLIWGLWLPLLPALLCFCGAGFTTLFMDWELQLKLEQRSTMLEQAYEAVHNGPLQSIVILLRSLETQSPNLDRQELHRELKTLDSDLRQIYESMRAEILLDQSGFAIGQQILDLQDDPDLLLQQVYDLTLRRQFSGFDSIRLFMAPQLQVLQDCKLAPSQKVALCSFLEEALCNVGKHAIAATRLDVVATYYRHWYFLSVLDNGTGSPDNLSLSPNRSPNRYLSWQSLPQGTRQLLAIAQQLRGRFLRRPDDPQGTLCQLAWPADPRWFKRLRYPFPQNPPHPLEAERQRRAAVRRARQAADQGDSDRGQSDGSPL